MARQRSFSLEYSLLLILMLLPLAMLLVEGAEGRGVSGV